MRKKSLLKKIMIKTIPVLGLSFVLIITVEFFLSNKNIVELNIDSAKKTISQYKQLRSYYTQYVVKKVKNSGSLKINFDHKTDKDTIPLPATLIHDLSEVISKEKENIQLRLYSKYPFPNRQSRTLDSFAQEAIAFYDNNVTAEEFYKEGEIDGKKVIRVAVADRMVAQACVQCHNSHPLTPKNNWQLNDVRGILEVILPIDKQLDNNHTNIIIVASILLLMMFLLSLAIFIIARSMKSQIEIFNTQMNDSVETGNLTARFKESDITEIDILSQAMNNYFDNLQKVITEVKLYSMDLAGSSDQLTKTSAGQLTAAQDLSENSLAIATAANQMDQNMQVISSSVEEISISISDVAHQSNEAARMSKKAQTIATSSKDQIVALGTKAQEIGKVISLVSKIASQTKLLALNAAIEAASAGEAGKGFAVVAEEVKELARQVESAAEEITNGIESIQVSTQNSVENNVEVNSIIEKLDEISTTIAASVEEQSVATKEIATNIFGSSTASSEVTKNINNVSSSTKNSLSDAEEISKLANSLNSMSENMSAIVMKFKVD
ncbi:MAG: methyl-accepting chemotaxis protein [Leptospirales bacterium]